MLISDKPCSLQLFDSKLPALSKVLVLRLASVALICSILMFLVTEITSPVPMRLTDSSKPEKTWEPASFCVGSLMRTESREFSSLEWPVTPKNSISTGVVSTD